MNIALVSHEFCPPHRERSPLIVISSCFEPAPNDEYVSFEETIDDDDSYENDDEEEEEVAQQRDRDGRERLASAAVLVVRRCGMEGFRLQEDDQVETKWGRPRGAFQREGKIFRENERRRH